MYIKQLSADVLYGFSKSTFLCVLNHNRYRSDSISLSISSFLFCFQLWAKENASFISEWPSMLLLLILELTPENIAPWPLWPSKSFSMYCHQSQTSQLFYLPGLPQANFCLMLLLIIAMFRKVCFLGIEKEESVPSIRRFSSLCSGTGCYVFVPCPCTLGNISK